MPEPQLIEKDGLLHHVSVGAIIHQNGKYLLIDRNTPPYGFAGIAGHVDEDEKPEKALKREIQEESGLDLVKYSLLLEELLDWNWCSRGIEAHHMSIYDCQVNGTLDNDKREVRSIHWYTVDQIKLLKLELVWDYWFKKLKIL